MRYIIPDYLLRNITEQGSSRGAECARKTLSHSERMRALRVEHGVKRAKASALPEASARASAPGQPGGSGQPNRFVSDAQGGEELPGVPARTEGEPATGDPAVDEAYDGLGASWQLLFEAFGRDGIDGAGGQTLATVHYGRDFANAFWDGTQLVFGDGDGELFNRMTMSVDVIAHELAHGLIDATSPLDYQDQSGALNESIADVLGAMTRQYQLGQQASEADWLIGAELFAPGVQARALRSMLEPGTAYDDPRLGRDLQPGHMRDYVVTTDDNGGVHINSGIPNRAFALAARAFGGESWRGPGVVWMEALTGGLPSDCDFATFAARTIELASARGDDRLTQAISEGWQQVGVAPAGQAPAGIPSEARPGTGGPVLDDRLVLRVRRSGGVAGLQQERQLTLSELGEDDARAWRELIDGGVLQAAVAQSSRGRADDLSYRVICEQIGLDIGVAEHDLPGDSRDLLRRTLRG